MNKNEELVYRFKEEYKHLEDLRECRNIDNILYVDKVWAFKYAISNGFVFPLFDFDKKQWIELEFFLENFEPKKMKVENESEEKKDNWAHRSKGMKCKTCMWYKHKVPEHNKDCKEKGRCRKRAPTLNGWPVVFASDWCGDHKLV